MNKINKNDMILENNNELTEIKLKDNEQKNIFLELSNSDNKITCSLSKNSQLTFNCIAVNTNCDFIFDLEENSQVTFNLSVINQNNSTYKIDVNHLNKNSNSIINNHGINLGNELKFIVNGKIDQDATGSITNQNSSIILFDNKGTILPNLIIDNNDVVANHSSYIGEFKKEWLFYLESRCIPNNKCYEILSKAFLIGHMNLEYKQINSCLNILDNYWR